MTKQNKQIKQKSDEEKRIVKIKKQALSFVFEIKKNWQKLLVFFVTLLLSVAILYLDENTTDALASYVAAVEEYEVGQVADKTIFAPESLAADEDFPVTVEEGEKIIRKGFAISEEDYMKLKKIASSPSPSSKIDYRAFLNDVLFLFLLSALGFILHSPVLLGKKIELKEQILEGIFFVVVFAAAAFGSKAALFQSVFALPVIIPSALCALLTAILFGQTSAMSFSILLSLGIFCVSGFQIVPMLFTLASTISIVRIVRHIEKRIDMIFASIILAVLDTVFMIVFKVIFNDNFSDSLFVLPGIALNGIFSGILALGLLTPLETALNTASVFRLMDLSDVNNPVLRKLLLSASGTYNHSMMVASLAENACKEIGANALLARVAAYYHDIGKMEHPEYFTENNIDGMNRHEDLNPSLSVSIIKSHIKIGVEKAHQMHLPKQVIDIIAEHHGNSLIAFFYNKAKEKDPSVSPEDFSYPGNPPSTKESAVVMLADVCEAACKSLDKPTATRIEKFIQQLVSAKIDNHQLDDCALTFGELALIKDSFVQVLVGYYHGRIKYQNQKDPDENPQSSSSGNQNASSNQSNAESQNSASEKSEKSKVEKSENEKNEKRASESEKEKAVAEKENKENNIDESVKSSENAASEKNEKSKAEKPEKEKTEKRANEGEKEKTVVEKENKENNIDESVKSSESVAEESEKNE